MYPALAVHNALLKERPDLKTLWVGGEGGIEAGLIERTGIPFKTIPAAGVHGVGLKQLPRNLLQVIRGMCASMRILNDFKPDVLFFTGGYVAFPMAVVGWLQAKSALCTGYRTWHGTEGNRPVCRPDHSLG